MHWGTYLLFFIISSWLVACGSKLHGFTTSPLSVLTIKPCCSMILCFVCIHPFTIQWCIIVDHSGFRPSGQTEEIINAWHTCSTRFNFPRSQRIFLKLIRTNLLSGSIFFFFFTFQQSVVVQKCYTSFIHAAICGISRLVPAVLFYFIAGEFYVLLDLEGSGIGKILRAHLRSTASSSSGYEGRKQICLVFHQASISPWQVKEAG